MRILLIEDDTRTAAFIVKGLKQAGYAVDRAADGEEGLNLASAEPYDVLIADIMLPRLDGLGMISALRARKVQTPTIVLSARGSVDDRVKGLQAGGDDYLTKPFSFSELLARVQALIRRAHAVSEPTRLTVADLSMDLVKHQVRRGNQKIDLQPKEYALLQYLMFHAGQVVSKTMIMEHVWDYNFDPLTNVVEARISKLRDKVDRPFKKRLIHTVRGVGYVCREEI
jgi:two-component system OmpR family response regulator